MGDAAPKTVVVEDAAARARLVELGLDEETLLDVVRQGERARAEATDHDPANAAGTDAWRYRVRTLRDFYVPRGWLKAREDNLEYLKSGCGTRAVLTRAGDEGTGLAKGFPQPQSHVGEATARAVDGATLWLDPSWINIVPAPGNDVGTEVWILLVHRAGDVVRAELSLPTGVTEDGRFLGWVERLLLPEIDLAPVAPPQRDQDPGGAQEFDVPVTRKR